MKDDPADPIPTAHVLPCARCGVLRDRGRDEGYFVEVRAVADAAAPVFTVEDLERDTARAIDDLLRQIRSMSEAQLERQVYARTLHFLCPGCYSAWFADPFGAAHGRSST